MDLIEQLPVPVLTFLYPIKECNRTRTKELTVLCLGLGRTGTESLRLALYELGYSETHHGFRLAFEQNGEAPQWYRLALAKYRDGNTAFLNRQEFDKVLGDCEALTDLPSVGFGVELLRAYPEAKVVLNRRKDVNKWHASVLATLNNTYNDWGSRWRQLVDSENFWLMRIARWNMFAVYEWDMKGKGIEIYKRHYAELEEECTRQGREWLDWTVQDGWEPLCEFVGRPVPDTPFPRENGGDDFQAKRRRLHGERYRRANRKLTIYGLLLVALVVLGIAYWMNPDGTSKLITTPSKGASLLVESLTG